MKKKILTVFLTGMMACSLAACGSSADTVTDGQATVVEEGSVENTEDSEEPSEMAPEEDETVDMTGMTAKEILDLACEKSVAVDSYKVSVESGYSFVTYSESDEIFTEMKAEQNGELDGNKFYATIKNCRTINSDMEERNMAAYYEITNDGSADVYYKIDNGPWNYQAQTSTNILNMEPLKDCAVCEFADDATYFGDAAVKVLEVEIPLTALDMDSSLFNLKTSPEEIMVGAYIGISPECRIIGVVGNMENLDAAIVESLLSVGIEPEGLAAFYNEKIYEYNIANQVVIPAEALEAKQ